MNLGVELEYLAVHPSHQRHGIATALVASGMRAAEELGLDMFILAFRAGWKVYERLGFVVEKVCVQDGMFLPFLKPCLGLGLGRWEVRSGRREERVLNGGKEKSRKKGAMANV